MKKNTILASSLLFCALVMNGMEQSNNNENITTELIRKFNQFKALEKNIPSTRHSKIMHEKKQGIDYIHPNKKTFHLKNCLTKKISVNRKNTPSEKKITIKHANGKEQQIIIFNIKKNRTQPSSNKKTAQGIVCPYVTCNKVVSNMDSIKKHIRTTHNYLL